MKKLLLPILVIFVLMTSLSAAANDAKRLGILDFEFGTVQRWWSGNWDIGRGISDLIVTELVNDGTYRLIERRRLDEVLNEQDFTNSNRADPATAARIGQVLGVNAIVVGSITEFGTEKKRKSVGGRFGRVGGFGGANIGTTKGKAKVAIDARVVDINTGEILAVARGVGESSRSGLLLKGIGGGAGGFGAGGIDMGSSDFRETILGEAVHEAVVELSQRLISQESRIPATAFVIDGLVADVDGSTLILNVGTSQGVSVGDTLTIKRVTRTVKDPATGRILREITSEVGRVRIDEADSVSAVGTLISGSGVKVGDKVVN